MDLLLLSQNDVRESLDLDELVDALATGFKALSGGQTVVPGRNEVSIPGTGFLMCMPSWQPGHEIVVKLVAGFHGNYAKGIPSYHALICAFDPETGRPVAVMDGSYITAMRTAGAAALATRLLAREGSRVLAIIGAGAQGDAHLRMIPRVRDFKEIRVASLYADDARKLVAMHPAARLAESHEEAVRGADVICLCTASGTPVIEANWVSPGAHITSVGYAPPGAELPRDVILRGRLFVETRSAFDPVPAGSADLAGLDPEIGTELGEVLSGARPGRRSDDEITIYKSMGHAMEDMVAANLAYRRAARRSIGQRVHL
jgi:ornithine cyclodeaminase/thiomorpholine-carboxylate dehydrogenase